MIYKTITNYKEATKDFLENEKQFHLGVIPTEQSNPITKNLSATIAKDTAKGVKTIFNADKYVASVARTAFHTPEFAAFIDDIKSCILKCWCIRTYGCSNGRCLEMLLARISRQIT